MLSDLQKVTIWASDDVLWGVENRCVGKRVAKEQTQEHTKCVIGGSGISRLNVRSAVAPREEEATEGRDRGDPRRGAAHRGQVGDGGRRGLLEQDAK